MHVILAGLGPIASRNLPRGRRPVPQVVDQDAQVTADAAMPPAIGSWLKPVPLAAGGEAQGYNADREARECARLGDRDDRDI